MSCSLGKFYPGNIIRLKGKFRNKESRTLENPFTVTLYIYRKDGDRTTVDEGDLTNSETGIFTYDFEVPLTTQSGVYYYGYYGEESDGTPYAYSENHFTILPSFADPYDS